MLLDILEDHLDEAVHLFGRRCLVYSMLDMTGHHLAELDARLRAHLEGFLLGGEDAWALCSGFLEEGDDDEAFVAAVTAMESNNPDRVSAVRNALAADNEIVASGVGEALALTKWPGVSGMLIELGKSEEPRTRSLALAALLRRGIDPGPALDEALDTPGQPCTIIAIRSAGLFQKKHFKSKVEAFVSDEDPKTVSAALECLSRLDPEKGRLACLDRLESPEPIPGSAFLLGATGRTEDLNLLTKTFFNENPSCVREAMLAVGNLGYTVTVPHLIRGLEIPGLGGVAGVALQRILGSIFPARDLMPSPESEEAQEPETGDEEWTPDDDLPLFSARKVQEWWDEKKASYSPDMRYRIGDRFECAPPNLSSPLAYMELESIETSISDMNPAS